MDDIKLFLLLCLMLVTPGVQFLLATATRQGIEAERRLRARMLARWPIHH